MVVLSACAPRGGVLFCFCFVSVLFCRFFSCFFYVFFMPCCRQNFVRSKQPRKIEHSTSCCGIFIFCPGVGEGGRGEAEVFVFLGQRHFFCSIVCLFFHMFVCRCERPRQSSELAWSTALSGGSAWIGLRWSAVHSLAVAAVFYGGESSWIWIFYFYIIHGCAFLVNPTGGGWVGDCFPKDHGVFFFVLVMETNEIKKKKKNELRKRDIS